MQTWQSDAIRTEAGGVGGSPPPFTLAGDFNSPEPGVPTRRCRLRIRISRCRGACRDGTRLIFFSRNPEFGDFRAFPVAVSRHACRVLATVGVLALAGCATTPSGGGPPAPTTPEAVKAAVAARAKARWEALVKNDIDRAYTFLSPGFQRGDFTREIQGDGAPPRVPRREGRQRDLRGRRLQGPGARHLRSPQDEGNHDAHRRVVDNSRTGRPGTCCRTDESAISVAGLRRCAKSTVGPHGAGRFVCKKR